MILNYKKKKKEKSQYFLKRYLYSQEDREKDRIEFDEKLLMMLVRKNHKFYNEATEYVNVLLESNVLLNFKELFPKEGCCCRITFFLTHRS